MRPARRARLALATPPGLRGFLWRWYPLVLLVIWIPIATEAGAVAAHFSPLLGRPIVPGVYAPWDSLTWLRADVAEDPLSAHAIDAIVISFLACYFLLIGLVLNDFSHGRNFGIFNAPILVLLLVSSIDMMMEGIPPAYTWLGGGRSSATYHGRRTTAGRKV